MSELERLRYETRMLKAQLTQQQMEIDFLKKLEAVILGRTRHTCVYSAIQELSNLLNP